MRPAQVRRVIQEMRAQGYVVRVKHLRPTTDSTKKRMVLMTARQAREAGVTLQSDRGETHVSVYEHSNPTVRLVHETATANSGNRWGDHEEHFRKDLGTAVALGRALNKLHAAGLLLNVRV